MKKNGLKKVILVLVAIACLSLAFTGCYTPPSTTFSLGPAGGLIFYDKGIYSDGWRYLKAAPSDQSTSTPWGCYGVSIPGLDDEAVGSFIECK